MKVTRRAFLGASTAALAGKALGAPAGAVPVASTVVDIHCHMFNGSDLPITGFLAHVIPGLSDISRELTSIPEMIVRRIVGVVHQKLINRVTPGLADEQAYLTSLGAGAAKPVVWLEDPAVAAQYRDAVQLLANEIAAIPLLHLDATVTSALLDRVIRVVYLAGHERARIAATMATVYPEVQLYTPLLVDYDAWSSDKPATPLCDQIDAHGAVARASMHDQIGRPGARFHPFVAFDPLREVATRVRRKGDYRPYGDARVFTKGARYQCPPAPTAIARPAADAGAIELVRYAIETAGFIGCKVYPPVGFAPLDNEHLNADPELGKQLDLALRAFYAYCEAEHVPITAHTSAGNEYGLGFHDLVAPSRWEPVLREFPSLRVNFGHFGHEEGIDPQVGVAACGAWMRQAAALMNAYPNVYADFANSPLVHDELYATKDLGWLDDIFKRFPRVRKRVMYGSDFWLNRLDPGADDFVKAFQTKLDKRFGPDQRADAMGTNALRFLGFLDDQGKKPAAAAGRNRARLRRFYGQVPQPTWLFD
jgi:predicted TIM-barrel fold metal-dependent hydrolase